MCSSFWWVQVNKPQTSCSGVTDFQILVQFTLQANSETCPRENKISLGSWPQYQVGWKLGKVEAIVSITSCWISRCSWLKKNKVWIHCLRLFGVWHSCSALILFRLALFTSTSCQPHLWGQGSWKTINRNCGWGEECAVLITARFLHPSFVERILWLLA